MALFAAMLEPLITLQPRWRYLLSYNRAGAIYYVTILLAPLITVQAPSRVNKAQSLQPFFVQSSLSHVFLHMLGRTEKWSNFQVGRNVKNNRMVIWI